MILRRPYAFLIKHFRLINFLLAIFAGYIAYLTYNIVAFFSEYISNGYTGNFYEGFYTEYIPLSFYVGLILICFLLLLLCGLFLYKKKNNKVYVAALIYYIVAFALIAIVKNEMITMESNVITAEAARAFRDISLIVIVPQAVFLIFFLMYGFGFNFSKFNFQQDLRDLQITEEDSEEVEITIKKDNVKLQRNFRRFLREFRYYIKENKFFFIVICIALVGLIGYGIYLTLPEIVDTKYIQGETFNFKNLTYRIEDSIITNLDYNGNYLKDNKYYLVVKLYVKNNSVLSESLNTNNFRLEVGSDYYYPITDKGSYFIDYAKNFSGTDLKKESENIFSLIYEIGAKDVKKTYRIKINNGSAFSDKTWIGKFNYVTITPVIVDKIMSEGEYDVGKEINFSNSYLKNTTFTVTDYSIENRYYYTYKHCLRLDECETYQNMINLGYKSQDKSLLILGYKFDLDKTVPFYTNAADVTTFASTFFKIRYSYEDEDVLETIENVTPNSDKSKLVFEVNRKVREANHLWLSIIIRNKEYLIKLK